MFIGVEPWLETNQDKVLILAAIVFFMVVGYFNIRWVLKHYKEHNVIDAQGIKKILSITAGADQVLAAAEENKALGELLRQLMSLLKDERFTVKTTGEPESVTDSAKVAEANSENET